MCFFHNYNSFPTNQAMSYLHPILYSEQPIICDTGHTTSPVGSNLDFTFAPDTNEQVDDNMSYLEDLIMMSSSFCELQISEIMR